MEVSKANKEITQPDGKFYKSETLAISTTCGSKGRYCTTLPASKNARDLNDHKVKVLGRKEDNEFVDY